MKPVYWKDKRVWGWAMYDFANSAFATTVLAAVFNVYFVRRVVPPEGARLFGTTVPGAALWGYAASFSMLLIFFVAPVLGALADHAGRKKPFLTFFWLVGCLASAGLVTVGPGDVWRAVALFTVANIGFAAGNVFYNAFLTDLGDDESLGRVSGFGWAVGYVGGGLCLALNLLMIKSPGFFGLPSGGDWPVRAALASVGVWWFVFGLPMLAWVRDKSDAGGPRLPPFNAVRTGLRRLADTARHLREHGDLVKFLAAYLVYNDGIETIILMASLFGAQELGMAPDTLVLCFLMIQGVAFAGALGFGWLADRLRHKTVITLTLVVYAGVTLWAWRMKSAGEFWALGAIVGLVLGGSQAVSRSLMGLLTPPEKSAEFFSFFGLAGKFTAVAGPLVFGVVSQTAGLRAGVLSLLPFFLAGGALLAFVKEPRPRDRMA